MIRCRSCNAEIRPTRFCSLCGENTGLAILRHKWTLQPGGMSIGKLIALIISLALSGIVIAAILVLPSHPDRFRSHALAYIRVLSDQGTSVTGAMINPEASNPTAGIEHIKHALLAAQAVEARGYADYSESRDRDGVPSRARAIASDVDDVHRQFQETMSEFLMYWKDNDAHHLVNGGESLKTCFNLGTVTTREINAELR